MLNENEIIKIITEQNIPDSEKDELIAKLKNDHESKEILKIVREIEKLSNSGHIDSELLAEYILYQNGDEEAGEKIIYHSRQIENHLSECEKCNAEYKLLRSELTEIDEFLDTQIQKTVNAKIKEAGKFSFKNFIWGKYKLAIGTAAAIILLLGSLTTISEITTPRFVKVTSSFEYNDFSSTRGRNSASFAKAVDALENENFEQAVTYLTEDINKNEDELTIFYSYYILGIIHVSQSKSDIAGLLVSYNNNELKNAIEDFQKSIELNKSGLFNNINANSYFFIGQANLLLNQIEAARENLSKSVNLGSEFSNQANELLNSI